jgi:hypothetical protein
MGSVQEDVEFGKVQTRIVDGAVTRNEVIMVPAVGSNECHRRALLRPRKRLYDELNDCHVQERM